MSSVSSSQTHNPDVSSGGGSVRGGRDSLGGLLVADGDDEVLRAHQVVLGDEEGEPAAEVALTLQLVEQGPGRRSGQG